jgi:hypothetical protein
MEAAADSNHVESTRPKLWSKAAEEKLKKEFLHLQREKCKESMTAFAVCAKQAGFMVTFRCRDAMNIANECLHQYTTDEQYAAFKRDKIEAWVREGVLVRPKGM